MAQISARSKSPSQAVKIKPEKSDRELLFSIYTLCMKNKEQVEILKEKVLKSVSENKKLEYSNNEVFKKEILNDIEKKYNKIQRLITLSVDEVILQSKNYITDNLHNKPTLWEKVKMFFKKNHE